MPKKATGVAVTFTLNSTALTDTPPYDITGCGTTISYDDGTSVGSTGWNPVTVGTPQSGGATFTLAVTDNGHSAANPSSIGNWALTFIPRGSTGAASPFGNNVNTLTGNGGTLASGSFTLNFSNPQPKIKDAGSWDWALMVQINLPGNVIHCYSRDPQMDVDV